MHVGFLGPLEVRSGGKSIAVGGTRLRTLLIRLALDAGRAVHVGSLSSALWPDETPVDSGHAVQTLVSRLRRALPDDAPLRFTSGGYCLGVEPQAVDALRFEALAREGGRALREGDARAAFRLLDNAIALWRGEPLCDMPTSAFVTGAVARLEELRLTALEDRAAARLTLGTELPGLIAELEALSSLHPHRERLRALLIRALDADGRTAEALGSYEQFRSWLADQLGIDPSPDLQQTQLAVLRGQREPVPPMDRRHNLRAELTSFVGRDPECEQLRARLAHDRLLTLVGAGGTGKTRLATALAGELADELPGGAWLVELAAVSADDEVATAVLAAVGTRVIGPAQSTGASGSPHQVVEQLVEVLSAAETLVVLDNCEHVIGGAARIAEELLGRCPRLGILATSREALGILGETLFAVPPLALPRPRSSLEEVSGSPAVRLFRDRAASVRPGFEVTAGNASAVADVCRRLDGLPLAIELAAARLRTLSVEQLAARLDDRFGVLTGGSRTARPAHRTLRAVVAWSWDMLDGNERRLAETLSVFPAAFTLEAAEGVDTDPATTLDTVTSLVEKSVLQAVDGATVRFRMLETIRAYGMERLAEQGGLDRARRAHAACFLALAESAEPHLRTGAGQVRWARLLADDRDHLLAALHFACESEDASTAVRIGAALWYFWMQRGEHALAVQLLRAALSLPGRIDAVPRAVATVGCLLNGIFAGDPHGSGSVPPRPSVPDASAPPPEAHPALALAAPLHAWISGDSERGLRLIDAQLGATDPWTRAMLRFTRAMFGLNHGDVRQGCRDLRDSARDFAALGERWGQATTLTYLAVALISRGRFEEAVDALTDAMKPAGELGGDGMQRIWLAVAHRHAGRVEAARGELQSVVTRPFSARHIRMARLLLGDLARLDGDVREAARQYALAKDACSPDTFDDAAFATMYWTGIGRLSLAEDDPVAARYALRKALAGAGASGDMMLMGIIGVAVAQLLYHRRQPGPAAVLLGASHGLRGAAEAGNPDISRLVDALTRELGEAAYTAAYDEGRGLDRDDAVALIRSRLDGRGVPRLAGAAHA
ncbi:BTAD domain-containing putative transcriptional regulator [Streptomyces sp. NPDC058848]|uniref:BTAD domain-containing putative transcriptional regulator n=1 Tax=unclassified Streptomyces TaxID=2593676 RepID=UPI0036C8FCDD